MSSSKELTVASYNMYCRPRTVFWDNQIIRAKLFAKTITEYENSNDLQIDVLCLQEIFDNKVYKILKKELKKIGFLFRTKRTNIKKTFKESIRHPSTLFKMNGGTIIFSRWPIISQSMFIFDSSQAYVWNAMSTKGCIHAKILKNAKYYNTFTFHLDSFSQGSRKSQMVDLKKWIDEKCLSHEEEHIAEDEAIILCGDWNIDFHTDEKNNIDEIFEYKYPELIGDEKYTMKPNNDWVERRITSVNDPDCKYELLDFFAYDCEDFKCSTQQVVKLKSPQMSNDIIYSSSFFLNIYSPFKRREAEDISDHYMVLAKFKEN